MRQMQMFAITLVALAGAASAQNIEKFVISGDAAEGVSKLKDETDGAILVAGSGTLVQALLAADLVDELRLMVFPTILGRGRRLFPDGIDRLKFRLAESRTVGPDGVQVQVYARAA